MFFTIQVENILLPQFLRQVISGNDFVGTLAFALIW